MDPHALQDIRDPAAIEAASMAIIEAEVPEPRPFAGDEWLAARRIIHATADFELLRLLRFHPRAVAAGLAALAGGCLVLTDTEMARAGVTARRLTALGCRARCLMNDPEVVRRAAESGGTRAAAAVDAVAADLAGSVYVVGNAPTALLALLDHLSRGGPAPALIVGMPVGFVNAAPSKALLAARSDVPSILVEGRKAGSAMAAAAVNALADLALAARPA